MTAFNLSTFTFNDKTLRVVEIDGKPWFLVKEVAELLDQCVSSASYHYRAATVEGEFRNVTRAEADPELRVSLFPGSISRLAALSESGLYKVILRAQRKNPAARAFQDWVTQTVIPAIRKEGGYVMGEEKVATGEVTAGEVEANLWRFFEAKLNGLRAQMAELAVADREKRESRAELIDKNAELRAQIKANDALIAEIEAAQHPIADRYAVLSWQHKRLETAKLHMKMAERPEDHGFDMENAA